MSSPLTPVVGGGMLGLGLGLGLGVGLRLGREVTGAAMRHDDPVRALLPRIEAALHPFDVRPHWGKWNAFDGAGIAAAYPRLAEARALYRELDPEGVFGNAYQERLGVRD